MAGFFSVGSFRIQGAAATPQVLLTIENIDTTKLVYIRRVIVQLDPVAAALTAVMPQIKCARTTAVPTGGTTTNKGVFDTTATSNANTTVRQATASDGGALTAITATAGDVLWQQYCHRMHTSVGQVLAIDSPVLPLNIDTNNFVLHQNQALGIFAVAAVGTSNPATNMWIVNVMWEEN